MTIKNVTAEGIDLINRITINHYGIDVYEFALDDSNGFYQESNVFINNSEGLHTIYARDRSGCGTMEDPISVLGFPEILTPNGAPQHDTWRVIKTNTQFNQNDTVQIFNRYEKLITEQITLSEG